MTTPRRTKAQQREDTMRALVAAARQLFATHGYGAVGLSQIVQAAGVTKGALYHHFGSKADLFRAVMRQVQADVAERVAAEADTHTDRWTQLVAGSKAFLAASSAPEIQRIMIIDGPAVLGWDEWRAMDEAASARHLTEALTALIDLGELDQQPVEPIAHLLSGAMNEAALWLAQARSPSEYADMEAALVRLLESLRRDRSDRSD